MLGTGIENPDSWLLRKKKEYLTQKKSSKLGLNPEPCRKPKTNNQQFLRDKLKLKLKCEVNLRFKTQI